MYARLERSAAKTDARVRALIGNDLAVIAAMEGKLADACQSWRSVLVAGNDCPTARLNLGLVQAELTRTAPNPNAGENGAALVPALERGPAGMSDAPGSQEEGTTSGVSEDPVFPPPSALRSPPSTRVAVLSFLFNWPSTGGGNMHTAGLVEFLGRDGFEVRHFLARYPAWGIGKDGGRRTEDGTEEETFGRADGGVGDPRRTGTAGRHAIEFTEGDWDVQTIGERFRSAVDSFAPDYVVISDAWNMKPHLAEAMRGYSTILLMQAQECLCPLNNLRLIGLGPAQVEQCPRNQLATPQVCHQCLTERGHHAGALHQVERALAGVGTPEYDRLLRQSFYDAEAVLVLNPITAAMLEPFARRVCIVPWGIDPARFPWPTDDEDSGARPRRHQIAEEANPGIGIDGESPRHCSVVREGGRGERCRPIGAGSKGRNRRRRVAVPGVCTPGFTISPFQGFRKRVLRVVRPPLRATTRTRSRAQKPS